MKVFILFVALFVLHVQAKPQKYPKKFGDTSISGRIIGGQEAPEGFAPYQVALKRPSGSVFCSGAILSKDWVITAGSCSLYENPSKVFVQTGTNQVKFPEQPFGMYPVDAIYHHCRYDGWENPYDISLIHLSSPILFNDKTQPIELSTEPLKDDADLLLTGWGAWYLNGSYSDNLQMIYKKPFPLATCKEMFTFDTKFVGPGQICTYTEVGSSPLCFGDVGDPLVSDGKLVGIGNHHISCAYGYPEVYTSTYFYLDWINEVMSGNTTCTQ